LTFSRPPTSSQETLGTSTDVSLSALGLLLLRAQKRITGTCAGKILLKIVIIFTTLKLNCNCIPLV
jgi:hypothetical protein